ncbi:glutamine amidotransferase [Microbacterium koreense]|uniref:Lipid II isoglutaminyl synthase (glutamine-hydrolyzing) subunit GatD n=1 Tax=Microbacterium koreense TaxID=323761 RepID=A0ABW2ZSG2_9MICO
MSAIHIVQLYPDLLGVTGDKGNVDVLATRAQLAGVDATITRASVGDTAAGRADVIVIGNGPLSAMRAVCDDLSARRAWLEEQHSDGAQIFAVGGGAELLSRGVDLVDGGSLEGLGMIPARVARTRERRVGYLVAETPDGVLVGFEDHASLWRIDADSDLAMRYGRVRAGHGSVAGGFETIVTDGIHATNVQGPVLPLNPWLADRLLTRAATRVGLTYAPGAAHAAIDVNADAARADIERLATEKHFTAIQL